MKKERKEEEELEEFSKKWKKVFNMEPSEGYKGEEVEIKTPEGKRVNRTWGKKIPEEWGKKVDELTRKLVENKIIEESRSDWCNPVSLVEKPDGTLRLCENMRELNTLVEDDLYPLPDIGTILMRIGGKKWFTVIDLKDGYFQIRLEQGSKKKTAFQLKNRLYQSTRLVMGYKNSPAIFQRIMNRELDGVIEDGCEVYLDDIIVYGDTVEEHDRNLERVMERLQRAGKRAKERDGRGKVRCMERRQRDNSGDRREQGSSRIHIDAER
ncbi:hypothetical protein NEIRO03_1034 [Nematocida sp. AWRm78]|nr:hypothetical protein NEIRO02_1080 [Nematocida sp. AWRm79]KAI5183438.1 hypothetical protein NEIRO03_1034 [Nematocida sp. AWRm78]